MPEYEYGNKVKVTAVHDDALRALKDRHGQSGTVIKIHRYEPAVDVHFDDQSDSFSTMPFYHDELEAASG